LITVYRAVLSGVLLIESRCLLNTKNSVRQMALNRGNQMEWRNRISIDAKVLVGKPVIKGTRIAVEFVVDLLGRGWTAEQILQEYDHLTAEDIQACLAYASEVLRSERVYLIST
jgi:uncharacterized protein (DUF433 family)